MADPPEYLLVVLDTRRVDLQFIMDAAEKRFIHKLARRDIGAEDHQLIEVQIKFLPRMENQVVYFPFQRVDPPVQEVLWANQLTSKIVNNEDSPRCLNLQRGFIVLGVRIELQIEHLQSQLPS